MICTNDIYTVYCNNDNVFLILSQVHYRRGELRHRSCATTVDRRREHKPRPNEYRRVEGEKIIDTLGTVREPPLPDAKPCQHRAFAFKKQMHDLLRSIIKNGWLDAGRTKR